VIGQRILNRSATAIILVVVSGLIPRLASAQATVPVSVGQRVRITAPALPVPLYGEVARTDPASGMIVVSTADGNANVALAVAAISQIDVSRGRSRQKAALIAGAIGALVAGGAVVAQEGAGQPGTATAVAAFGATGFTIGALAGSAYAPERWDLVYQQPPNSGTVGVVLSGKAKVKRFANGDIGVAGEPNRRRGMIRGAVLLGALALVFGGIDKAQGELDRREYLGAVAGNALVGAALGYLVSPRGWQRLPGQSVSQEPVRDGRGQEKPR
jgi:hypothetical protein